jgi:hypothetical protein
MIDETEVTETTETEPSLRDDIEASLAELTAAETPEPAPVAEETNPTDDESEPSSSQRERDAAGRFAKKTAAGPAGAVEPVAEGKPAEVAPAAPAGAPVAAPAPVVAEPAEKAPQSWKPLAREHWTKLPPEVRQEVVRREQETNRVLQESATARRTHAEFQEAIRPFEAMIRSEAGDPIRGIQNLLGFAYNLRTGSPTQKAQLLASAIQGYGVDIEALASALDGQPQAQRQQAPYDPRVDQLYQRLEQAEQARQQAAVQAASAQLEDAASRFEFFEDLRYDMADYMDLKARQGQKVTLQQAYERTLALSDEHQKIVKQREAAKNVVSASAQTQRARVASSSLRSAPAVAPPRSKENTSLREDLEETMRELQGR